ncbi:hypothetical protein [Colwellia sp. 12G3]|uniref:hypothetical protein n=1 Tax=Colwellia sp. 12G3 TaxID=2058299 RepID=UPI000C32729F|nr:hypothetical protein [Colwellia sp. 12G3]PKI17182.1 hypothetical protein CXF71_05465 [Colwellia sp. 12G3]
MHKLSKDRVIKEFELLTEDIHDDELLKMNLNLFKLTELDGDVTKLEPSYQSFCLLLMELIVQKEKTTKKSHSNLLSLISDEEKYFLKSLYD